jgi:protein-ribulosamine 3-kinase
MPGTGDAFIKTGPASALDMFEAEAEGLRELAAARAIRVPAVIDCGIDDGGAFIAIERLRFERPTAATETALGEQLAALHGHSKDRYGWHRDNTIGPTPQQNPWTEDWVSFFREHRLGFQLELAASKGYGGELQTLGTRLVDALPQFFDGYEPQASLCHGDLWSGNWGVAEGVPVIFDPAVYYGDRESDIAMTMLFGGFGRNFYRAYGSSWPMQSGHEDRLKLYQLYHVINHLNLFGTGYLGQAINLMRALLGRVT